MIHSWPTSSYDFKELIGELEKEYYIAVIDMPGYGFSDKPKGGYRYSIPDDAQLVDHFIREVLGLSSFTLFTHDKGDSVGFAFLALYQQTDSPAFGQFMTRFMLTPDRFTTRLSKVYSPALTQQEQLNMSSIFRYQGGTTVFPETLRYLDDRHKLEKMWLQTLSRSEIPATLIWGEQDPIAKTDIADFVWENHLRNRTARALSYAPRNKNVYFYQDRKWTSPFAGGSSEFMNKGELVLDDRIFFHYVATGITPAMAAPKVGTGSAYGFATQDENGEYLDGGNIYKVTLPASVPVNNFWSFMVYSGQHRSMLETDQKLAGLDSNNESVKPNADGSYTMWFGPKAPKGHEGNWIQTMPKKSYSVLLRLYGPLEPWFDKTWKPGDFKLVK